MCVWGGGGGPETSGQLMQYVVIRSVCMGGRS